MLIHPDMTGYGLTDFDKADSIIAIGEREARKHWNELVRIAQLQKQAKGFRNVPTVNEFRVDTIQLQGEMPFPPKQLKRFLPVHKESMNELDELQERIGELYATGLFRFIEYRPVFDEGGKSRLLIKPELRQGYDTRLRLGLQRRDSTSLVVSARLAVRKGRVDFSGGSPFRARWVDCSGESVWELPQSLLVGLES